MTDEALFPGFDPPAPALEELSADRRRTLMQHAKVANGIHPLTGGRIHPQASRDASPSTGSAAFTCGTCVHRVSGSGRYGKDYPKCLLPSAVTGRPLYVTAGAGTDCRAWWPACENYQPKETP